MVNTEKGEMSTQKTHNAVQRIPPKKSLGIGADVRMPEPHTWVPVERQMKAYAKCAMDRDVEMQTNKKRKTKPKKLWRLWVVSAVCAMDFYTHKQSKSRCVCRNLLVCKTHNTIYGCDRCGSNEIFSGHHLCALAVVVCTDRSYSSLLSMHFICVFRGIQSSYGVSIERTLQTDSVVRTSFVNKFYGFLIPITLASLVEFGVDLSGFFGNFLDIFISNESIFFCSE